MQNRRKFFTGLACAFLLAFPANAQRSHWYSGDLLTNNQIQCIVEDARGFVWIGTEYGLNKFDGYQFSSYFHDESGSGTLANNYVRCMRNASDGKIWVGTAGGLQLMNPDNGEFLTIPMPSDRRPYINQIEILSNGEVWFIASGTGVCRVICDNGTYMAENVDFISRLTGTANPTCFKEDSHGILWVGTGDGVYQCNTAAKTAIRFSSDVIGRHITGICEGSDGSVFVSTYNKVYKWDRNKDSVDEISMRHSSRNITHMFMDGDGVLYVAFRGEGLRWYNEEQNRLARYDDKGREPGLLRMDVSAFHADHKGNLWLGCYLNGVMLIQNGKTQFKSLRFQDYASFPGGSITAMAVDISGRLWCGFLDNPVTCFDLETGAITQLQDQPYASCLYLSRSGNMWAGLYNGNIALLDTDEKEFDIKGADGDNSAIISIVEDDSGCLYYASRGSGFGRYNPDTGESVHWTSASDSENASAPDNDWINALVLDAGGMLWIGHNTGVSVMNTETGEFSPLPQCVDISGNTCNVLLCDKSGKIWMGTSSGLAVYDRKTLSFRFITTADGLSNNSISGLQQDADGMIWCSTRVGLNRIDPATMKIDRFYSGYGLLDKSYNTRACTEDRSGRTLFWGSRQGVIYFAPSDITGHDNVGNVVLTGFYLDDIPTGPETQSGRRTVMKEPLSVSDEFHLSYKDNSFTLEFSTFDYGNQDCITYEYSFNRDQWNSTPAGVNRITFTRVSPGRHQLSVRAVSNNNISETSSYTIIIASPWYLSVWAIIAYVMCIACIAMVLGYNNKQRHIRELSEAKLQSFTNVAHELCSPLTMMVSPLDELMRNDTIDDASRRSLRMMHRASAKIMSLVNQLLDIRKFDEGQMHLKCRETDMVPFVQSVYEMFIYSAGQHNIRYSFDHSQDEMLVWIDRDSIEKIISNLLSNAFKYTPDGGEINIALRSGTDDTTDGALHHYMEVSVTDSGIGLDVNDVNRVFERFYRANNSLTSVTLGLGIGLNYSRILVEMHHGTIKAANRDDSQGSRFWFRLPLGNSHLKEDEMVREAPVSYIMNENESVDINEPVTQNVSAARGYKVLVIDDDESILDYISQGLRASYYKVIVCKNGKEGLHTAISQMPDVIISDVVMPEMDGISFVRALRNNPNISHIPVILLSARNKLQDRLSGMETGADVYLPKPFYLNELKLQVASLINNRLIVRGKFSGEQEQKERLETPEVKSNDELLMDRIMNVLNDNISNPDFSVEMLADIVGVSRTQLHRKLKNMTGLSAGKFIYNIRIRHAATLLEQGGLNISEIADMSGFNTAAHFATAFKNYYGMTPSEYVKSHSS